VVAQRASHILVIAETSSGEHFQENLEAAALRLPRETNAMLDELAAGSENTFRPHW
jgi:diketogulonate reductase-like aldo/keto reductase